MFSDITNTEMYKGRTEYSSKYMKPFDFTESNTYTYDHQVILAQGPSYCGMTSQITNLIKADPTTYGRILVISDKNSFKAKREFAEIEDIVKPNVTLGRYTKFVGVDNFIKDMENIKDIQDIQDPANDGAHLYDLMICDGIESILEGIHEIKLNNMHLRPLLPFLNAFKRSKRIIMTDTKVTQRIIAFLQNLKDKTPLKVQFVMNTYNVIKPAPATFGHAYDLIGVEKIKRKLFAHMLNAIKNNKKVCVVTTNEAIKTRIIKKIKANIWTMDMPYESWMKPEYNLIICGSEDIDFHKANVFDQVYVYRASENEKV